LQKKLSESVVPLHLTRIWRANYEAYKSGKRRALNEGGTYSSKTWSILQLLILLAHNKPLLISVVSESLPHLKRGAMRDFFRILGEDIDNNPRFNKTESTYKFPNALIEFFGADESDKVRGPRRDILFLNEANNIPWETARGLDIRTRIFTFADWNPISEFWAHENWISQPENAYIHSTYHDAERVVPPEIIKTILAAGENDPNWANVYIHGRIGKVEGLVYPYFEQVGILPGGDCFYGLDFGFSGDPAALVKCVISEGCLYCQELLYEKGLTNQDLAIKLGNVGVRKGFDEIYADAAEPKSIEEIHRQGFNIKPAPKGEGSIEFGHQKVTQLKQFWTKDSVNGIKEQRNFRYIADKNGKLTEKTTHIYSHLMDARRYAVVGKKPKKEMAWFVDTGG
jgi:phage terminase large subunit